MTKGSFPIAAVLILILVVCCVPFVDKTQPEFTGDPVVLREGHPIGQSFVARFNGLKAIEVDVLEETSLSGTVKFSIHAEPTDAQPLTSHNISAETISSKDLIRFNFDKQNDSSSKYYYFLLTMSGQGELPLSAGTGATYLDGALYQDGFATDGQLSFRLVYDPLSVLSGLMQEFFTWIWLFLISVFLFVIPGAAVLVLLYPHYSSLGMVPRIALASGISIILYPLLMMWTDIPGIHLGELYAWLPGLSGSIYLLWRFRHHLQLQEIGKSLHTWKKPTLSLSDLGLLLTVSLIVLVRFFIIRSLDLPLWGDSIHHTTITELLVRNRGLFDSWEPLAQIQSLTYHFGFHANAAVLHWITGIDIPKSVLWIGQLFNCFAVFNLILIGYKMGGRKWGNVLTLLLAGLLIPMPNYYVNWGRFTQLAGQVVLPVLVYLIWELVEVESRSYRHWILTSIVYAGLGLTHYRILIFAIFFHLTVLLFNLRKKPLKDLFMPSFFTGIGGAILFFPWFVNTFEGSITTNFIRSISTTSSSSSAWMRVYNAVNDLLSYLPLSVWILLALTLIWGIWHKNRSVAMISTWWTMLLLATNPQWFRLPGEGAISNFALFIAAYIPASLIIGAILGNRLEHTSKGLQLSIVVLGLGIWGTGLRLDDLDLQTHALATRPDVRAAEWIKQNLPADSNFLANSFFAFDDTVIVGSDGGWWLRLLTHRESTLPPTSYGSEKGPRIDYRTWVNQLTAEIIEKGIEDDAVLAMLLDRGVTHLYIGQRNGQVNNVGPELLPLDVLQTSEYYQLIYHQDHVWIFEFTPRQS